ncbi:MAG: energy-coupling factor transporter transmembrane protein EcfT [Candidatus Latescibacteria bacterium]|nr:energy-coupling factor transporter transmembrane protein EcfT [Candidatus Latescibacterota bacterium]
MLNDITLGRYIPVDSVVHRLDPRTKLGAAAIVMVALFTRKGFEVFPGPGLFLIAAVVLSGLPVWTILRNLRPFLYLFLFTFCLQSLLTPGESIEILRVFNIAPTVEGVREGTFFLLRLMFLVITASLLSLTTAPIELADGLERLLRPFSRIGFPAHEMAMMTMIALRFIPTLIDEAERLKKAQLARGASFEGGLLTKAKRLLPLLVPLFLSAFRKADTLALAMEVRGYRGGEGRTSFTVLHFRRRDYLTLACCLLTVSGIPVFL